MDRSGRSYGVVAFGAEAEAVAAQWQGDIPADAAVWRIFGRAHAETEAELARRLSASATGLRLMVVGPERDVLAAAATARAAGLIDAELTLHVTSTTDRLVYCVHCKTTSSVDVAVGEVATCGGCGVGLLVFAHLSRRSGSYLGFMADAEERA